MILSGICIIMPCIWPSLAVRCSAPRVFREGPVLQPLFDIVPQGDVMTDQMTRITLARRPDGLPVPEDFAF